jgi:hypothetical protein
MLLVSSSLVSEFSFSLAGGGGGPPPHAALASGELQFLEPGYRDAGIFGIFGEFGHLRVDALQRRQQRAEAGHRAGGKAGQRGQVDARVEAGERLLDPRHRRVGNVAGLVHVGCELVELGAERDNQVVCHLVNRLRCHMPLMPRQHVVEFGVAGRRGVGRTIGLVEPFDAGRELPERAGVDLPWREPHHGAVAVEF